MKLRGILAVILAVAIAAGVYVFFSTREDNSRGMVTLWYEKGSPLAGEIEKLAESYNSDMSRNTLPIETKCFESEEELAEAYETGTPDILLCSHLRAFSLYSREKLADISGETTFTAPEYPKTVQSRNGSIGTSFFPVGMSVPVMVINNSLVSQSSYNSFEDVFSAAADYTRKTGKPFFACDSIAELYYVCMLRFGEEFNGVFEDINSTNKFLDLYNTFAEATFDGNIAYLGTDGIKYFAEGAIPCVITTSDKLKGIDPDGVTVCDVPAPSGSANTDTMGTAYGFAITNGGCRSKGDTAAFISWVLSNGRSAQAALDCMLVPATEGGNADEGSFPALLGSILKKELISLPTPDSDYISNRQSFEDSFIKEMERLMP